MSPAECSPRKRSRFLDDVATTCSLRCFPTHLHLPPATHSSEQIQLQRLIARAGPDSPPEDARARIASQAPLSSKLVYADHVIDNSGNMADLDKQVEDVVQKLRGSVAWYTWLACWLLPPFGLLKGLATMVYRLYFKKVGQKKTRPGRTRESGKDM